MNTELSAPQPPPVVQGARSCAKAGRAAGFDRLIGFDMGGTSSDVSLFAGEFERTLDTRIAGHRIRVPMLGVHTVAAGGVKQARDMVLLAVVRTEALHTPEDELVLEAKDT